LVDQPAGAGGTSPWDTWWRREPFSKRVERAAGIAASVAAIVGTVADLLSNEPVMREEPLMIEEPGHCLSMVERLADLGPRLGGIYAQKLASTEERKEWQEACRRDPETLLEEIRRAGD
jgi:hypothetical protein